MTDDAPVRPTEPLPWHRRAYDDLRTREAAGRLPQTLLLSAPSGTGLAHFADVVTARLLCMAQTADERPCGTCRGCKQWQSGNHPDALALNPEGAGQEIGVDAVREALSALSLSRHYDGYRVARLHPAEALNRNAANAMLKSLEEPGPGTVFLLLSEQPRTLLATIRSRAQNLALPAPDESQSRAWLEAQGLSDIDARIAAHPVQPMHAVAAEDIATLHKQYTDALDSVLKSAAQISDCAKSLGSGRDEAVRFLDWLAAREWRQSLETVATTESAHQAVERYRLTLNARAALRAYTPPQLALESLLISWRTLQPRQRTTTGPRRPNQHEAR